MPENYTVSLKEVKAQLPDVKTFTFNLPDGLSYEAGQFVALEFPKEKDENGKPMKRYFSIASSPLESNDIELCVKISGNFGKRLETLGVGGHAQISPPSGKFLLPKTIEDSAVFLATGTGISPIMSMLRTLKTQHFSKPMKLFYGVRQEEDVLFRDELDAHAQAENFDLNLVISSKKASSRPTFIGRIDENFLRGANFSPLSDFFLCGQPDFVKSTVNTLLELGVPDERIHRERW